jgi:hypothetical protein
VVRDNVFGGGGGGGGVLVQVPSFFVIPVPVARWAPPGGWLVWGVEGGVEGGAVHERLQY